MYGPLQLSAQGRVKSVIREEINKESFCYQFFVSILIYYMFDIIFEYIVSLLHALV